VKKMTNINLLRDMEKELYAPVRIEEVDGNEVRPGVLGMVDFINRIIIIPSFRRCQSITANILKKYIVDHELNELGFYDRMGRAPTKTEHAQIEADYLLKTKDPIAIATHYIGLKYGRAFSKMVDRYFSIKKEYRELVRKYGDAFINITECIKELLGLKPLQPAYEYADSRHDDKFLKYGPELNKLDLAA
jgi:hypothetical protein